MNAATWAPAAVGEKSAGAETWTYVSAGDHRWRLPSWHHTVIVSPMQPFKDPFERLAPLEAELGEHVQREEGRFSTDRTANSLWDHLLRVATLAERLGRAEGVDPLACRIAGLFHDAGKFASGKYHQDDKPEEQRSAAVLLQMGPRHGLLPALLEDIREAILQLYLDDPEPTPLARVLFDADNLDKIGPLGIANYFVKAGLRGNGVSSAVLSNLTVELTYARHAPDCLATPTGRALARERAPQAIRFLRDLLETLRRDGLYTYQIEEVTFGGLVLDVVSSPQCSCGNALGRRIWEVPGMKCREIHLEHRCGSCGYSHETRFCRPRLIS